MARFSIWAGPPADAQVYKRLKWIIEPPSAALLAAGRVLWAVRAWRGKALKPFAYYSFKSEALALEWIERAKRGEDAAEEAKAQYKAAAAESLEKMLAAIDVGTVLHYSWGYDQTNCEFFQVTEKRGRRIRMREIASELVPDAGVGPMSGRRRPKVGEFLENEPERVKIIGAYGVPMDFGSATPTDPGRSWYCSWYA